MPNPLALLLLSEVALAVMHGELVPKNSLLDQVSVKMPGSSGEGNCSGTRIAPNYILTAAHCAGVSGSVAFWNGSRARIANAWRHPLWDDDTDAYDFAVLELAGPVPAGSVAVLPNRDEVSPRGATLIAAGFGYTEKGQDDGRLRMTKVIVTNPRRTKTEISANGRGTGICGGDSGGGGLAVAEGQLKIFGVSSSTEGGEDRYDCSELVVFANVTVVRSWIMTLAKIPNN